MSADLLWILFLRTGLPEAYLLYCKLRGDALPPPC